MSDLVGNPEDLFSHNEAHIRFDGHWPFGSGDFLTIYRRGRNLSHVIDLDLNWSSFDKVS